MLVGALLCEPDDASCAAGVIFFNNVGCIGMCGHGTIGLVVTLAHLGRIGIGTHRIETPVGIVTAKLHDRARVTVSNVRELSLRLEGEARRSGVRRGHRRRRLGRQLVLPDRSARPCRVRGQHRRADRRSQARYVWRWRRRGVRGRERRRDRSHRSLRPAVQAGPRQPQLRALSRASPTTARRAAPAPAPSSRVLPPTESSQPGEVWRQESVIGTTFEASFTADEPRRRAASHHR